MVMMGYLLKEALKNLCGISQWSYAVFWKFGCQNPKLLIWEECYYEPASCYGNLRNGIFEGNKVHVLVNKMMVDNQVNVVGEGLVGRVGFSGNHQWILSENYYRETHPPEVLKEVCLQFSAGMQTVAVVPILPHGVAQFGSYSTITENIEFVDGVVSLIHQLGCVPGVLQSTSQEANELAPKVGFPVCPGYPTPRESPLDSYIIKASSFFGDNPNYIGCSSQTSAFDSHIPYSLPGEVPNEMQSDIEPLQASISSLSFPNQYMNGLAKAEVIPSDSFARMNPYSSPNIPRAVADLSFYSSSTLTHASTRCTEQKMLPDNIGEGHFTKFVSSCNDDASRILSVPGTASEALTSLHSTSSGLKNTNLSKMETSFSDSVDHSGANSLLAYCKEEMKQNDLTSEIPLIENPCQPVNSTNDRTCFESQSGEDLFDILGSDFKDQWLNNRLRSCLSNELTKVVPNAVTNDSPSKNTQASSEMYHLSQGESDNGISSFTGTNHLLDGTNTSGSPAPTGMLPYVRFGVSDNMKGDLLGMTKTTPKAGMICSSSLSAASLKEDSGIYSQGSSIYDPWIERGHNTRQSNSAPTGYSTKPHEPSKSNRKRLKPGESPRPRPKDRQMIQDRVKELRDIVPNGAKCSIDTLLERTIKHMLFLQSVAKHADKLKQTAESKIISKDGGLLLKDNHGGATWAYEVGSQSMVCPIIVEDLNQPHQMLVEMICEERGLFLEIADIIRGLGLTILKGLMETRNDKIWAQFSVEANRNVTRMEIFLSLVRLLEQNAKTGVPQPSSTNNMMVQEVHQAAPLPASGGMLDDSIC